MAEQVLIQFRADKELKQEVADIYEQLGMDLPTAFRMFMVRSRIVRGLPFEATLPEKKVSVEEAVQAFSELRKQANDLPEFTAEEIEAEIAAARSEKGEYNEILCSYRYKCTCGGIVFQEERCCHCKSSRCNIKKTGDSFVSSSDTAGIY